MLHNFYKIRYQVSDVQEKGSVLCYVASPYESTQFH
jgi:hypothetical protein